MWNYSAAERPACKMTSASLNTRAQEAAAWRFSYGREGVRFGKRLWWAVAAALAAASGAAALAEPPIAPEVAARFNVLKNPSFEEGGALPAWWSRYPPADAGGNRHVRDTSAAHWGKASALIISRTPRKPGTPPMQWNKYGLPVEGGTSLIVSYWTKTQGVRCAGAGIHFYAQDNKHVGFERIEAPADTTQWTVVQKKVRVPRRAAKMGFVLYANDLGKTWYDDVYCLATPKAKAFRATPQIDGRLDEGFWTDERALRGFVLHTGAGLPQSRTEAWIAYDDTALYVAFRCWHAPGAALRMRAREHDSATWLDDSVEIFLDPAHRHDDYYHLCVNCLGVTRDAHKRDTAWESGARAAAVQGKRQWTVEVAIPYERLGVGLETGDVWGINLVRNDRVHHETATWSLGGFHDPTRFGDVQLHPDVTRWRRRELRLRVAELRKLAQSTREEISRLSLSEDGRRQASAAMKRFGEYLARLEAAAAGNEKLGEEKLHDIRMGLERAREALAAARKAAAERLFMAEGPGGEGFYVALADSLTKVPREQSRPFSAVLADKVSLTAARHEAESFQLVVAPRGGELKGVRVEAPPLRGPSGGDVKLVWWLEGYVQTAQPAYETPYVGWWPDPLLPPTPFDVAAGRRQPLWFTAEVPPSAQPGIYTGKVRISVGGLGVEVPVELRVRAFRLPRPGTLATAFGIYLGSVARWWYRRAEDMPIKEYARWCEFLGRYRLAPKNAAREYEKRRRVGGRLRVEMPMAEVLRPLTRRYYAPYSYALCRMGRPSVMWRAQRAAQVAIVSSAARPGKSCCVRVVFEANDRWAGVQCPADGKALAAAECQRVEMRLRAADEQSSASQLEVFLNTAADRYRARVALGATAWHQVTIPLAHFLSLKGSGPMTREKLKDVVSFQLVVGPCARSIVFFVDEVVATGAKRRVVIHDCDTYKRQWAAQQAELVRAHAEAWHRLGMPRQVFIYGCDEPRPWQYPFLVEAYRAVHEAAPGYPIMQTLGDRNPEALVGSVDIWCPLTPALEAPFYAKRRRAGDEVWTYVCCGPRPPYANFFIDQPATAHRVLFWQAWKYGASGFLYWCMTWWAGLPRPVDSKQYFPYVPVRVKDLDTYKHFKVNGDGLLIYPGLDKQPYPSVRLEVIRDGIEDYEYLALLSRLVKAARRLPAGRRPPEAVLSAAERLLEVPDEIAQSMAVYTDDPAPIMRRREQVARAIERLMVYCGGAG